MAATLFVTIDIEGIVYEEEEEERQKRGRTNADRHNKAKIEFPNKEAESWV